MTERNVTHATFVIERTYGAAPARVFNAFADAAAKARWFVGPDEWERSRVRPRLPGRRTRGQPGRPARRAGPRLRGPLPRHRAQRADHHDLRDVHGRDAAVDLDRNDRVRARKATGRHCASRSRVPSWTAPTRWPPASRAPVSSWTRWARHSRLRERRLVVSGPRPAPIERARPTGRERQPSRGPAACRGRRSELRTARRSGGHPDDRDGGGATRLRQRLDIRAAAPAGDGGRHESVRAARPQRLGVRPVGDAARGSPRTRDGSASERSSWTRSSSRRWCSPKRLATLDRLSGGRLMAGIGQGWMPEEFEAVGVPMARRGAGFEEHVAAMRACWRPDPVEHLGRWYRIPPRGSDRSP